MIYAKQFNTLTKLIIIRTDYPIAIVKFLVKCRVKNDKEANVSLFGFEVNSKDGEIRLP